ncbi:MAG: 4a-hydroxytetrahydrobiopterin dehydratase [Candidatus Neomarinimicrobiota bacterium]|jgi:4a-hydroxytetrahydrobiopterin dehydratase|nr:4a-hydroxytetrahydrobiopterin dehydratase [Candidatus Neomarinimicrobiota bacterium]MEC7872244.1 4a-hydroxytetrahydrobiopterin dehydratase [Candidatus Neomarinimicrobiota bacterium]MEC9007466.1 4a-hydroxytetrahydrobiopterin dehydratase [Candidatus Neomarinimicrobiota bacterium]MEC9437754.1 4a-hydroxytetrahydrobiopterin dehydratase [Candidatus Neomarinimicrobiota bacterium]MEC9474561.1 4a-hydroxytetrahydrobiopterin dehydratase [Candidatus Neomarinimicrobiota bacterium]|tara:strand:- start:1565 stop:1849 length:285 start_codon:yes stop_codon:yes gene_type:complete
MSLIDKNKIDQELDVLIKWNYNNNSISRKYTFDSYMDGIEFVHAIALIAEKQNHHPDILIGWCSVEVNYTSHDLGGVTKKCLNMAKLTEELYKE